jgi:hypothetical protein
MVWSVLLGGPEPVDPRSRTRTAPVERCPCEPGDVVTLACTAHERSTALHLRRNGEAVETTIVRTPLASFVTLIPIVLVVRPGVRVRVRSALVDSKASRLVARPMKPHGR